MVFAVEAWTIPSPDDKEPCLREMVDSEEFADEAEARRLA